MASRIPEIRTAMEADRKAYDGMTCVFDEIELERRRQIEAEGWTPEHDDTHTSGQMALAAACYAMSAAPRNLHDLGIFGRLWPWDRAWLKPKSRREDLVRAGALIVAEIERLDRAEDR
jgi:hypothetical protein